MSYSATASPTVKPAAGNPFEINRRVLASDLTLAARAVLLVILDHARHGLSKCTASTGTIAREARVTDRTVRNVVPELEARRLIRVERVTGSKHSRHTIYVGPCIHQVGNDFPLQLHEVGNDFHEVGNRKLHEVGNDFPQRTNSRDQEKDGLSLSLEEDSDVPSGPFTGTADEFLTGLKSVGAKYKVSRNGGKS
jgi:hypothetical protein